MAPHESVAIQDASEESFLNQIGINVHTPVWVELSAFNSLAFLSPQLQTAILHAMQHGFPDKPLKI